MKSRYFVWAVGAMILATGWACAVEPAYTGQLGNAEEPALRPVKWVWHGAKALVYQTKQSFCHGNMSTPIYGTVETCRGVRRGTVELVESTYKGSVHAIPPHGDKGACKRTQEANRVIEEDLLLRNVSDAAFSWHLYPALKVLDHAPVEDEETVQNRELQAKEIRDARKEARPQPPADETDVERAQKAYIGERAQYGER